jgi:putative oxygen-independent coproporphyrinogen III oxidase
VHVPFCKSRCDYCAFATWTDRHHLASAYVDACIAHLDAIQRGEGPLGQVLEPWPEASRAASLYLGGGTPSQLGITDLTRLLGAVELAPHAEVTIEANPEDVSIPFAEAALSAGATRISLGVQSLDQQVLDGLGRRHDPAAVRSAVAAIRAAGIGSYSIDLIYGGAKETDEGFRAGLEEVMALDPAPSHVSAYALTVEPGTPLWRDPSRHPDDDAQARRYEIAESLLSSHGLSWYEISNWARPGHESRHNLNYWLGGDYLAIGAAAHGHRAGRRWWNLRTPERYIEAVSSGRSPIAAGEQLEEKARALEALELLLRTRFGVPAEAITDPDGVLEGLLEPAPLKGRVRLTCRGRLLANEVSHRLQLPEAPCAGSPEKHEEAAILHLCPSPFGG